MIYDWRNSNNSPGACDAVDENGVDLPLTTFFINTETGEYQHYIKDSDGNFIIEHVNGQSRARSAAGYAKGIIVTPKAA